MPIKKTDLLVDSQALYERVVKELVTDIPLGGGMYKPQLNFSGLVKLVTEQPKEAQFLIQMLAQSREDKDVAKMHGTWLMMALIAAFGEDDESVRMTRMIAHDYYEEAVLQLRATFGS